MGKLEINVLGSVDQSTDGIDYIPKRNKINTVFIKGSEDAGSVVLVFLFTL